MSEQAAKAKSARSQERRAKTSRDILDAARRVLAEQGYHGTKVSDIARTAGVGVGTFYLYYPTKEAAFLELVEDGVSRLKASLDTVPQATRDPAEIVRLRIQTFFNFAAENRELFRIVFSRDAAFLEIVRRSQELFVRDILDNLALGMRIGTFRSGNAAVWAQATIGVSIQVVTWWINQDSVSITEVSDAVWDLTSRGILAGSSSRAD